MRHCLSPVCHRNVLLEQFAGTRDMLRRNALAINAAF